MVLFFLNLNECIFLLTAPNEVLDLNFALMIRNDTVLVIEARLPTHIAAQIFTDLLVPIGHNILKRYKERVFGNCCVARILRDELWRLKTFKLSLAVVWVRRKWM